MDPRISPSEPVDPTPVGKVSPSDFMRKLRPEYYSDTEDRTSYVLDAPVLEYQLESITQRNQTHDFEIFCRKLCERTICPNLRPQTGPEGGGDSKADTETYPVADEIAALTYVGEPNGGRERWAFAFSAKAKWADKVRQDVKGIVETGRSYDRIICVTSKFARAKDRARVEDQLSSKYNVPVTIHDRSWIVKEVIENDRKDLAVNYLKVGEAKTDSLRLGPTDYSRSQQLAEIECSINDPEAFHGMESQRVTEALVAAKLSRNLERPRTETDGRFARAIRLAEADGTYRQQLEARYEHVWTAFWWFDDFHLLNDSYGAFEALALRSNHARNLEFLCNLHQLLVNSVIHGLMTRGECNLDQRTAELRRALEPMAANKDRPNNALEAQSSLLIIRLGQAAVDQESSPLPDLWKDFAAVFKKASGLGEFEADRVVTMVEIAGNIAGNDLADNDLIEQMAAFVSKRRSEAEGALILLRRAQKLDFSDHFDMIRLLGKAAVGLNKKEYADHLIEALQLLTLAYRSAGLLWAARASCVFVAASIVMEGEEDNCLSVSFVPTLKIWAWLALELRHIPDFLFAIQLLNGALVSLPLDDKSKAKVRDDIRELDIALGSVFLNLEEAELRKLNGVPDILEALGLFMARSSLLYILGHEDRLRADGSLPETESDEDVQRLFSTLASQPVAKGLRGPMNFNSEGRQILVTKILGMTIEIDVEGSLQSILVSETVLGSLEAFFATAIEHRVIPHTEKLRIDLRESADVSKPSFEISEMDFKATLTWPTAFSPNDFEHQGDVQRFLIEVAAKVLCTTCVMNDAEDFLKRLYVDEAVQHRMVIIAVAGNSYHRVASRSASRMTDWQEAVKESYELRDERPTLTLVKLTRDDPSEVDEDSDSPDREPPNLRDHRAINIRSVIDIHAWDKARWRGTAYLEFSPDQPPCIALLFEKKDGARRIFERWRERFGMRDTDDEIYIAIVRKLPNENPHHYCIVITSKCPETEDSVPNQVFLMASRSLVMTPDNDENLERFLRSYNRLGAFFLLPALMSSL